MEGLRARFGYYTEYRFTDEGVLKVSLISIPRLLVVAFASSFLIVPLFLVVFTFYPYGVPPGPLSDLLVGLTMVVAIGPALVIIFWSVRTRARTPDIALPAKSITFIPYSEIKELRILGRQISIITANKKYTAALQSDSAAGIESLEGLRGVRLSHEVQDLGQVRSAKLIRSVASLLLLAIVSWRYVSFYSSLYYNADVWGLIALIAILGVAGSLIGIANSTVGNWITARDWSIVGYYYVWFALGLIAANIMGALAPQTARLTLLGTTTPVYAAPVFPSNSLALVGFSGGVGLFVVAGLFLSWSFRNTAQKLNNGLFRPLGPAYVIFTLLFAFGGVSLYSIFYILQAAAFLSIKVGKGQPQKPLNP